MIEFFMPMIPPTATDQEHRIGVSSNGKPYIYNDGKLKAVKQKLTAHLAKHSPAEPIKKKPVRLTVKWLFPITGSTHNDGEYKITKPDTDNLNKALKDCMTKTGFWEDDALVASEITEKFWAAHPGIYIRIEVLV